MPATGKFLLRPNKARSPSVTSMMTAGSVRGKEAEDDELTAGEPLLDVVIAQRAIERADRIDGEHRSKRLAAFHLDDEVLVAPNRNKRARRIEHPRADPLGLAAAQAGALE